MFSFWKDEYHKKNLFYGFKSLISVKYIFQICAEQKISLYESIEYTVGIHAQFMPTHSVDGKSLNRKANLFGKLKGILFYSTFGTMCSKMRQENLIWNRRMTMFQSRDWEILQETIFHVAVSIKSNIGKKNNFASVLFLLFLDYKQSIWKHNMNDFEQFCQPTCCLGERLLP